MGRALYTGKYGINGSISSKLWTFVTVVLKKCCKCPAVGLSHLYKSPEWNLETSPNAQPVEQSKMRAALVGIIGGHAKKYSFKGLAAAEKIQYKINFHDSPLTLLPPPPPPPPKGVGFSNQKGSMFQLKNLFHKSSLLS